MFYSFIFPRYSNKPIASLIILLLRVLFGSLLMIHGFDKLNNYSVLVDSFPSFMGMGSKISLLLVLFAELVCPIAVIVGFLYRDHKLLYIDEQIINREYYSVQHMRDSLV